MGRRKVKPEAPSRAHVHLSWLHAAVRFLHPEREEAARSFVARNNTKQDDNFGRVSGFRAEETIVFAG